MPSIYIVFNLQNQYLNIYNKIVIKIVYLYVIVDYKHRHI